MPLLLFTSPKGGVGKTTLAAHAAALLAKRGHRVLALDLDPQNALRLHMGISIREEAGFLEALDRRPDWRRFVIDTPAGVRLLPFGAVETRRALQLGMALLDDPELLAAPVRDMLAEPGLVVVMDSPPGPSAAVSAVAPLADLTVLVLLADAGSASLVPQIASGRVHGRGTLAGRAADRTAVVLNQVELDGPLSIAVLESAAAALGPRLLGAVCRDDALAEVLANRRLLLDGTGAAGEDLVLMVDAIQAHAKLASPSERRGSFVALADWGLR
jgi:cellulose synthase operon protein YhjQ